MNLFFYSNRNDFLKSRLATKTIYVTLGGPRFRTHNLKFFFEKKKERRNVSEWFSEPDDVCLGIRAQLWKHA